MHGAAQRSHPELPPFTRDGYRRLMAGFRDNGYRLATFADVRPQCRDLIVRHDVDVSLEAAVRVAELEAEMGIEATYFVMVSNAFYNIFSPNGRRMMARLSGMRHRIGLHFDATVYPTAAEDVLAACGAAIDQEFRVLATLVGSPIEMVSFHNPPREFVNRKRPPGSPPHTYEPRFFTELAYVPDSGGQWRFGGPFEHPAFKRGTAIHLLTHPIWWDQAEPTGGPEITLQNFAVRHLGLLHDSLTQGFKAYREAVTLPPSFPERQP